MISEIAPAKINLFLHVGPLRADGFHALESLFVFATDGDRVRVAPSDSLSLEIEGPFAPALREFPQTDNLVWRAAKALAAAAGVKTGAALRLDKRLPIASGIGGGSADAAATLRALQKLWRVDLDRAALTRLAFGLGADVPACLAAAPVYVGGAGERISPGPRLPPLWVALVNPKVPMPTGPVFRAFDRAHPSPPPPARRRERRLVGYSALAAYLSQTSNDLEPIAIAREAKVREARDFLARSPGSLIARMSGSGATVFGLFSSAASAERAARSAGARGWWSFASAVAA